MKFKKNFSKRLFNLRGLFLLLSLTLIACSPKFDWREVRNVDAPLMVLLPAKPASHSKEIDLDGIKVKMTMIAADVDQLSFAVAYAEVGKDELNGLIKENRQKQALKAMQTGMLNNIQGRISQQNSLKAPKDTIQADGKLANGQSVKLVARFMAVGPWVIQAVMIGNEKAFTPEVMDMFFGSIKFN